MKLIYLTPLPPSPSPRLRGRIQQRRRAIKREYISARPSIIQLVGWHIIHIRAEQIETVDTEGESIRFAFIQETMTGSTGSEQIELTQ